MPDKTAGFITAILSLALFSALLSCASYNATLQIENSLPQTELSHYNDSFDEMREDLWDRADHLYREEQMQNFKPADMYFKDGKLLLQTRTEGFSKGGLVSKYRLRGDFDIQLDFLMDFTRDTAVEYMDQVFLISVFDNREQISKINAVTIGLSIRWGDEQGYLFSLGFINGKRKGSFGNRKQGFSDKISNFKGSFRIVRSGEYISTLYKEAGATDWTQKLTARVSANDMLFGFQLRNFFPESTTIRAKHSTKAMIDRFTVNAAHKIIEEKI